MKKTFLFILSIMIIIPMVLVVIFSLFSYYRYPILFPNIFTLRFWSDMVLGNGNFYTSILTSTTVGIANGILASIVGIMTARALVKHKFIGHKLLSAFFSLPLFIPAIAMFLGVHLVMIKLNLINSFMGVVIAHMLVSIPYTTNIFISFFHGINPNMENVALSLGCNKPRLFYKIILPLIAPGVYLSFSISFLISFSEYFSTFLIGGGKIFTLSSLMYPYINNGDIGHAAVLGVIFILVNITIFFFADFLSRKNMKVQNYLFE